PNSMLPSARQLTTEAQGLFALDDWHNFGSSYDPTLMAWHKNFVDNWESIREGYDDRFYRMFTYYLLSCAAVFRVNKKVLW
ncbi:MAG: class I SAM-dependent methyltransferase, partial [Candidatus Latescibacterota bacterium]|nr:class I SAM-dependent methyltransferase [Candidatus Latescibacterota bacterium]